jgi:acetyl-CoA acetyltransferase
VSKARDGTAIVGVGATPYYFRGESAPQSQTDLAIEATLQAAEDAGIAIEDVDGFVYAAGALDTSAIARALGIREIRLSAAVSGGGGGAAGTVQLAAAAVFAGMAKTIVCMISLQQPTGARLGQLKYALTPESSFVTPSGLSLAGQLYAMLATRHMYLYGSRREHFAEVVLASRAAAATRPGALRAKPLTLDQYMAEPLIASPLCRYDFTLESDGAVAVIVTATERARDLRQHPVLVSSGVQGGAGAWGKTLATWDTPDDIFASSGYRSMAPELYEKAGISPSDVDVALLYDHFSPMVIMQLEDFGFCPIGEGGPFVAEGNIRLDGPLPVNPHGGHLSEAYVLGMTHVREAVEQLRGSAVNQIADAQFALVSGGPSAIPQSSLILRRA